MIDGLPVQFRLAHNISKLSTCRIKVGCVIYNKGHAFSVGLNTNKYSKNFTHKGDISIHAEANAIKSTGRERLAGSIAYVYREYADGMPALARPCNNCYELLKKFGCKEVVYTVSDYPYYKEERIL